MQLCQNADAGNEKWIVVDSDGEEDDDSQGGLLHENDLVAFFNQLPLDNIFRMLLGIVERNNEVNSFARINRIDQYSFFIVSLRIII